MIQNNHKLTATLLISCADKKGITAAVSNFIYQNGGNIIHADQHTDLEKNVLLQRMEWEMDGFKLKKEEVAQKFAPIAKKFRMDWCVNFSTDIPRMAVVVSKIEHCLYDILARYRMGEFKAQIPLIISNHRTLEKAAKDFGADFFHFPVSARTRARQEEGIIQKLEEYKIDLMILARYMQVLSEDFIRRYPNKTINIHHSFLPSFAGAGAYARAYERGVKIIGATAHYVTRELDAGPIIEQDVVRISHRDSVANIVRKGKDLEKVVLARAINLHLNNRVLVYGNKTVVFD